MLVLGQNCSTTVQGDVVKNQFEAIHEKSTPGKIY